MGNILRAWARSICRDWLFWAETAFAAWGGGFMVLNGVEACREKNAAFPWDSGAFNCLMIASIVLPVFCSITLGREYGCGGMRNKTAVGHGRGRVYFSALLVSFMAALWFAGVYLLCYLGLFLALAPEAEMSREPGYLLALAVCSLIVLLALAAFFTALAMLIQSQAWGVTIGLAAGFLFVIAGWFASLLLHTPEFLPLYASGTDNLSLPTGEMTINPACPQGAYRSALEFFYNYTLGGMVFQCSSLDAGKPWLIILNAGVTGALATLAGVRGFYRKDLR
ncbi:hypothetical protein [Acutalibacter sp. JLR.KK004]|uniref:hypothetical protein n=1 Tax=Acutalibacter sp. JLR.KK004 TaxID=3112622 RepID=UPI002FF0C6FE